MSDLKYSSFSSYYGGSNFFAHQADNIFQKAMFIEQPIEF